MACCSHQLHALNQNFRVNKKEQKLLLNLIREVAYSRIYQKPGSFVKEPHISQLSTSLIPKHEPSSLSLYKNQTAIPQKPEPAAHKYTQISQILRNLTLSEEKEGTR